MLDALIALFILTEFTMVILGLIAALSFSVIIPLIIFVKGWARCQLALTNLTYGMGLV